MSIPMIINSIAFCCDSFKESPCVQSPICLDSHT